MQVTDRFADTWHEWDEHVHGGGDPAAFLHSAKDEELLAGESERNRKYERDILATEIQNRLAKRSAELPAGATDVYRAASVAHEAALQSQIAIHTAGGILKANGDSDLGVSISAAATVSLDTTRLALVAARQHLTELQAALAQSRVAERLIEDAAHAALEAAIKAEQGAQRLSSLGHARDAAAAREAGARLRQAAEDAADQLRLEIRSGASRKETAR